MEGTDEGESCETDRQTEKRRKEKIKMSYRGESKTVAENEEVNAVRERAEREP